MRFFAAFATLAVTLAVSVFAQDTTVTSGSTTTITRTVYQATATSTVLRPSGSAVPTSSSGKASSSVGAAKAGSSSSAVSSEFMGAASVEQGSLAIVALAGAAVIAFGL